MKKILDQIELRQMESKRLMDTLRYYEYLREKGIDRQSVRGVARLPLPYSRALRNPVESRHSLKMSDGTFKVLDNVPFSDNVIFNRSYLPE